MLKHVFLCLVLMCTRTVHALVRLDGILHIGNDEHAGTMYVDPHRQIHLQHDQTGVSFEGEVVQETVECVVFHIRITSPDGMILFDETLHVAWASEHTISELGDPYNIVLKLLFFNRMQPFGDDSGEGVREA